MYAIFIVHTVRAPASCVASRSRLKLKMLEVNAMPVPHGIKAAREVAAGGSLSASAGSRGGGLT